MPRRTARCAGYTGKAGTAQGEWGDGARALECFRKSGNWSSDKQHDKTKV